MAGYDDEWWPIDLCFWPEALQVTESNKTYLDELIKKPPLEEDVDVEASTGPDLLTKIYYASEQNQKDIYTPRRTLFHPEVPWSKRGYNKIVSQDEAYGIHHCAGTWRKKKPMGKLKMAAKCAIGTVVAK